MAISNFIGPGPYGFKPDERPRAARAPSGPENQRRYAAALKGIGRNPFLCVIDASGPEGLTLENALICEKFGVHLPKIPVGPKTPPGTPPPPPPQPPPEVEFRRRWFTLLNSYFGGGGATVFSPPVSVPFLIKQISVSEEAVAAVALPNSRIFVTGAGAVADGVPDDAYILYDGDLQGGYADPRNIRIHDRAGPLEWYPEIFVDRYPARIGWFIAGSAVPTTPVTMNIMIEERPDLLSVAKLIPTQVVQAQLTKFVNVAKPPSKFAFKMAGEKEAQPLSNMAKIELLAQRLRESPFGVSPGTIQLWLSDIGLPQSAFNLVKIQSTKPPNIALLAGLLT